MQIETAAKRNYIAFMKNRFTFFRSIGMIALYY